VAESASRVELARDGTDAIVYGVGKVILIPAGRAATHLNERMMKALVVGWLQFERDRRGDDAVQAILRALDPPPPPS
jgi:hypothetical protein